MKEDFTSYIRDVLIDRPYILLGNHEPALAPALYSLITDALRGHVHPRVTGFDGAEHEDFKSLEDARSSMTRKGVEEFDEALKFQASDTATLHSRENYYYAVANGRTTGIFIDWKYALS
jgi:hypothetical protein